MAAECSQGTPLLVLFFLLYLTWSTSVHSSSSIPPPLPIVPLPSAAQLRWQLGEMALFLHFGPNTFTDSEWGTGHADPAVFSPAALDARQWARAAAAGGFSRVVLTAKHHDGFCLWPSAYTDYSVRSSPWRGGRGDVVAELASAAREFGIGFGIYLSPWDRHDPSCGKTREYNEYYLGQMRELLTRYGDIQEVWLDGAKGEGEKDMYYLFECWFALIHQLQPNAVIFSDAGPDSRWIGDEDGVAGSTCWSLFNQSSVTIGHIDDQYSRGGDPDGHDWVPPECDVSIRPGWFWHSSEHPKSAMTLLDIYYKSVGRNCLLILNVPPNSSGLISDEDLQVLHDFTELRSTIFSHNLAQNAIVTASTVRGGLHDMHFGPYNVLQQGIYSFWAPEEGETEWTIFLDLGRSISFNVLQVQEPVQMGQRVIKFHVDILRNRGWTTITYGTTIGYKRLLQFPVVETQFLSFIIDDSRADPLISYIGIYLDPFTVINGLPSAVVQSSLNDTQTIKLSTYNHSGSASIATI
ncbi:putative alpha-L-fucosidase 1 [Phoenix dactylifera]|uniref:alpha-L-fucosidase n=1 Tax=Phoenix dactylifera TaxID=42345 RepID=A0A8B7CT13_PHODC|nr:putative alpha-L-fucosidase 1 [Phoenix dactylifera]